MEIKTFVVPNISCAHCTSAIEEEVGEMAGVVSVSAEIDTRKVTVNYQAPATWDNIKDLLVEIEYPPE